MPKKINPELKKKWLKALRSGEYQQGTNYLRTDQDEFCCLGVLCDIKDKGGWKAVPEADYFDQFKKLGRFAWYKFPDDQTESMFNAFEESASWAFVGAHDDIDWEFAPGDFGVDRRDQEELARMNDRGASFDEIADWIEEKL